ncbi:MAG: RluA family pseudouridine synthase, partial [Lachnospiraceae bacterium]|nr:RluA family pseudouridine synthase [Lachnospiraceae bacterium]
MKEYKITKKDAGQRLDKYLKRLLPGAGMSFFYKMLRKKNIVRNGNKAEGSELLEEGDVISLYLSDETFGKMSGSIVLLSAGTDRFAEECLKAYRSLEGIRVILETDDIVIFEKPAGILTQKAKPGDLS